GGDRAEEAVRAGGRAQVRLRRRCLASRSDCASIREWGGDAGHSHHDALLRGEPRRAVRDDARVRARALRAPDRPAARALAARARHVARDARVAEPDVGEPRRPLAALLALLLPAPPGALPRRAARLRRAALVPRGE